MEITGNISVRVSPVDVVSGLLKERLGESGILEGNNIVFYVDDGPYTIKRNVVLTDSDKKYLECLLFVRDYLNKK